METLQERVYSDSGDPWRVLACCVLLARTPGDRLEPLLPELWPLVGTAGRAAALSPEDPGLRAVLRPLGLPRCHAERLVRAARAYVGSAPEFPFVRGVGLGPYAWEAWRMVVEHDLSFWPGDRVLRGRMVELRGEVG